MACTSGCRTQDHESYAACLKQKGVRTYLGAPSKGFDSAIVNNCNRELKAYKAARDQGIRPDGTTKAKVEEAVRKSDIAGAAYGRDFAVATPLEG